MGIVWVVLVFLSLYVIGVWLSVFAFNHKKYLGYVTTFLFPIIIVFLFGSMVVIYIFPALLVSLIVYHLLMKSRKRV
ncbi:hypothetical protein SAMN04490247_1006 [Salimicrobium halophilum]|uniref:Uncharacterized protein n=1 Tax=Salimicrobium halophilum TaxID=86666 RepID=A0A1G8RH51_9BACI|nr:hypothetical protein SAMN04490247_1006 [Salimicrobium halophilum]